MASKKIGVLNAVNHYIATLTIAANSTSVDMHFFAGQTTGTNELGVDGFLPANMSGDLVQVSVDFVNQLNATTGALQNALSVWRNQFLKTVKVTVQAGAIRVCEGPVCKFPESGVVLQGVSTAPVAPGAAGVQIMGNNGPGGSFMSHPIGQRQPVSIRLKNIEALTAAEAVTQTVCVTISVATSLDVAG